MLARVAALVAAAGALTACDDTRYTITIGEAAVVYAAWRDGDGAWQRAELDAPLPVTAAEHAVAIACEGVAQLWVYTSDQPGPHPPGAADYGCDPAAAALSARFWFIEPIADDPTCGWAEPRGVCPPITALPVAVGGAGADALTVVSLRSGREIGRSPTEATLYPPADAAGEQAVTVIAADPDGHTRALTLPIAPRLPLVVPRFELPAAPAIGVDRGGARWAAPVGRPFLELRSPGFALRTTVSAPLAEVTTALAIVDPRTLPDWDLPVAGFDPGAAVDYQVALFELGPPVGSTRAGATGTLTW